MVDHDHRGPVELLDPHSTVPLPRLDALRPARERLRPKRYEPDVREDLVVPDPRVLEEVLLVRSDHGLLPALAGERPDRLDVLPTTVTYRYSVEDGSRGLPTCWATSPDCRDTSGMAVPRRNASNSRSLPGGSSA
jgi:hypothetical protein